MGNPIGSGGYGVVFPGTDTVDRSARYAVKFSHQAPFAAQDDVRAFHAEMQAATRISHENVVRILFAATPTADLPDLVMEYAPEGTLQADIDRRIKSRSVASVVEVRATFEALIDGLEAINAAMLHRDIKPSNIMIHGGRLKIGEFGSASLQTLPSAYDIGGHREATIRRRRNVGTAPRLAVSF